MEYLQIINWYCTTSQGLAGTEPLNEDRSPPHRKGQRWSLRWRIRWSKKKTYQGLHLFCPIKKRLLIALTRIYHISSQDQCRRLRDKNQNCSELQAVFLYLICVFKNKFIDKFSNGQLMSSNLDGKLKHVGFAHPHPLN